MKKMSGILTTTHVDRHGDQMMVSALESALSHIDRTFVPVGVEHDPRIPPQGRLVRASIRQLDDGEYALEGEFELFEPGDPLPFDAESARELPIRRFPESKLVIEYDRQLRSSADQQDIAEIGRVFGIRPEEEIKKSVDPLAVLTIGGAFILGGIASGFLSRLGEDGYDILKARLRSLFRRRDEVPEESLLRFVFVVRDGDREVEVELIVSRPDDETLERLLDRELAVIDSMMPALLSSDDTIKRFVFEHSDGRSTLKFAVRRDAVPMFPRFNSDNDV
jgi:hypothetical protein